MYILNTTRCVFCVISCCSDFDVASRSTPCNCQQALSPHHIVINQLNTRMTALICFYIDTLAGNRGPHFFIDYVSLNLGGWLDLMPS